jgi:hypothetical protein
MRSKLQEKLEGSGIADLWQRRAEAVKERRLLEQQLAEVAAEISFFDRLIFFHSTEDEFAERRIKERWKDLGKAVSEITVEIEGFWAELYKDEPKIQRVRDLEEALRRSLVAGQDHQIKHAFDACRLLLEQALAGLADSLPSTEIEPESAVAMIFAQPQQAYLIPLATLTSLLELATPVQEASWQGARDTILYRPVLIRLVDKIMTAFAESEPENPFPVQLVADGISSDSPATTLPRLPDQLAEVYPSGKSRQATAELEALFEQLAGHDLALRLTRREISIFDRIVFWSDTPAEARAKILVEDRAGLCEEIAARWLDLERRLRGPRREQWEIYACDQTLAVRDAIRLISTASGESSRAMACPLNCQEQAIWQTQSFAAEVGQRSGHSWVREELLERAFASAGLAASPARGENGLVATSALPQLLGPVLESQGFTARYRAMVSAEEESEIQKDELRAAKGQISTWDRINVFKESAAEARESAMVAALSKGSERLVRLQKAVEEELEILLGQIHQPALVGLLLGELGLALDATRAECTSTTRSYEASEGDTRYETVFFCVIRGLQEAGELLSRLVATIQPEEGSYLPLWQGAETWALLDSEWARSIHVLSLTESS